MNKLLSTEESLINSRPLFEKIYSEYNKREYVAPDPLQFLYEYKTAEDREIVGLIASSLAYGRVAQILKSVQKVLDVLTDSPCEYLKNADPSQWANDLRGFVHRFTDENEMVAFLNGIARILRDGGSIESLFCSHFNGNLEVAAEKFVHDFLGYACRDKMYLIPSPAKGSACKRLALYLRWMVRCDDVDPGGWSEISPSNLVVPLDTHMFNICTTFGMCGRKSADGKSVREITDAFRIISPEDPVRYDFALTRFGIRNDMTLEELFYRWHSDCK